MDTRANTFRGDKLRHNNYTTMQLKWTDFEVDKIAFKIP